MNTTLKATVAAAIMTLTSVPASAENAATHFDLARPAPTASQTVNVGRVDAGVYGFGSGSIAHEPEQRSCDYYRKRAQWSDSHNWWKKYNRCLNARAGS